MHGKESPKQVITVGREDHTVSNFLQGSAFMWLPDTQQDKDNRALEVERDFHRGGKLLGEHISEALDNGKANGYDIATWPIYTITGDLSECDAGCQGLSHNELRPYVEAWLRDQYRAKDDETATTGVSED